MTVEIRRAPHAGWRALAATVLVMSGAIGAHTWAGGQLPGWPGLVVLGTVILCSSRLVLGGTTPRKVLLPLVVAGQATLHTSFVTLSGPVGHEAHAAHAMAAPSPWSGRMLLAHAAVTLLTLLAWRLCERAALAVVRLLTPLTRLVGGRIAPRPRTSPDVPLAVEIVLLAAPRRGPPVVACRPA